MKQIIYQIQQEIIRSLYDKQGYTLGKSYIISLQMGQASGALNVRGFTQSVNNGVLPDQDHITHSGIINQNYFTISSKSTKLQQLQIGNAISNCDLYDMDNRNYFISLFMKSSTDGQLRTRSLNVVIALDISGSMNSPLKNVANPVQRVSRLQLARRAIIMLIEKLKPKDAFSLIVFHNTARTIIPSQFINDANLQQLKGLVNSKFQSGGTTISAGFNESMKNINAFRQKNTLTNYENRIIMLTDVCDNSVEGQQKLITDISTAGVSTTIIGISSQFKSNTCEKLIKVKGFNYMCAVEDQDLQTYLVDQFDYTFFPCVQKVNIKLQSEDITAIKVFGSVDHDIQYPIEGNTFTVTKMQSGFPSALQKNQQGIYQMKGGLILIKYTPKTLIELSKLKIKVKLTYQDNDSTPFSEEYNIDNDISAEQYYSNQSIKRGVRLFYYAQTMRNLLKDMKVKLSDINKEFYLGKLKKLEEYCPLQKIDQLKKITKIVEPK